MIGEERRIVERRVEDGVGGERMGEEGNGGGEEDIGGEESGDLFHHLFYWF